MKNHIKAAGVVGALMVVSVAVTRYTWAEVAMVILCVGFVYFAAYVTFSDGTAA